MRRSAVYSQCLAMTYSHGGTALELFGRHIKQSGLWLRSRFGLDTLGPASTWSLQWSRKFHCSPSMLRGLHWRQDELDLLVSMYDGGATSREIVAKIPGRNLLSINNKIVKLYRLRPDLLKPRNAPRAVLTTMDYESIKRAKEVVSGLCLICCLALYWNWPADADFVYRTNSHGRTYEKPCFLNIRCVRSNIATT